LNRVNAERLYLRSLDASDCNDTYLAWMHDPEVIRFLETRHYPQTLDTIREFVNSMNAAPGEHLFGIFLMQGDRHIGNIKVGSVNPHHGTAAISLLIGARDCWNQGYASEAIAAVSRHAFDSLGVRKLLATFYAPNVGSIRAFQRVGYKEEGRLRGHFVLDGQPCDVIELGLLAGELP